MNTVFGRFEEEAELREAISELVAGILRNLIYVTAVGCLVMQLALGVFAPEQLAMAVSLTMPLLIISSAIALHLISRRPLTAQIVWQSGLIAMISLSFLLFRRIEILFLYVMVQFMSMLTGRIRAGAFTWAAIAIAMVAYCYFPAFPTVDPGYLPPILGAATFAALISWTTSRSLYRLTGWSLQGFAEARANMDSARRHRAQLAQVLKDLDQAYYRLERTNAVLVAAWRAATEAEQQKARFAMDLSHELRTPLNLVIGFSEMMLTAPHKYGGIEIPRAYRSDLESVYRNARHLDALVNDVLDLSRMAEGMFSLAPEEVDVAALIDETVAMVRDYAAAKALDLRVEVEPDVPILCIDRLRIRQVLLNLLVNAIRFTDAGWVQVSVRRTEDGTQFQVRDTGRGIQEQELPKVFADFGQVAPVGINGWVGGTGLGLPISRKLVELHGGQMGVESAFQVGTTFWFTLPHADRLDSEPHPQASALRRLAPTYLARDKRILVAVHSDRQAVTYLQRLLDDYRIVPASSAEEGIALASELKALALVAEGPVPEQLLPPGTVSIRCRMHSPIESARHLGVRSLLVKPFTTDQLLAAIDQLESDVKRILVADDDPEMVRLVQRMVTPRVACDGCIGAYDGAQALELIRCAKPDLVILDLAMPKMDGREVLRHKAQDPSCAAIPVIILSASDEAGSQVRLHEPLEIVKAGGLHPSELAHALDACLSVLAPGWR